MRRKPSELAAVWVCTHSSATELDVDIVHMVAGLHESDVRSMRDGRMLCITPRDGQHTRALFRAVSRLKRMGASVGTHVSMICPCCCRLTGVDSEWCQKCGSSTDTNFPDYVRIS